MAKMKTESFDYLLDSGLDIEKRRVYLYNEIDSKTILKVIKAISILVRIDESPITLVMNSPGGFVIDAFALYDYIKSIPNQVTIHVLGRCCSAAVLILQAADYRTSAPNSTFMVHRGSRADKFDKDSDERADTIIAERMGWTRKKLDNFQDYDNYFFPEEALELKLIDEVIE